MRLLFLGFGFTLCALPVMAQQTGPDILTIWDQFSISNAIASKCTKPADDKLNKFLSNYMTVTVHTSMRLKELRPVLTSAEIDQSMKDRYAQIDKAIANVIAQESCDGPRVQEALRRFDFQADLDFWAATKPQKGQ